MSGDAGFLRGDYKGVDALVEQSMRIGGQAESSIEDMLARVQQELGPEGVYAQQRDFLQSDYTTNMTEQLKNLSSRYGQTGLLTGQQNRARDTMMNKGSLQLNRGLLDIGQQESSTAWDAMSAINQMKSNALQSMPSPEYAGGWNYNPNTSFLDTWLGR